MSRASHKPCEGPHSDILCTRNCNYAHIPVFSGIFTGTFGLSSMHSSSHCIRFASERGRTLILYRSTSYTQFYSHSSRTHPIISDRNLAFSKLYICIPSILPYFTCSSSPCRLHHSSNILSRKAHYSSNAHGKTRGGGACMNTDVHRVLFPRKSHRTLLH